MSLITVLLSCLILFLTAEQVLTLGNTKKLINPPQLSRKHTNVKKIGTTIINNKKKTIPNTNTRGKDPFRIIRSNMEEKGAVNNRKIVLREITRKVPSQGSNGMTSSIGRLGQSAYRLTKSTLKASFDLLAAKHVSLFDIAGSWAVTQEVLLPAGGRGEDGATHTTPVIFHLAENRTIVTVFNGKQYRTKYSFKERAWPRYCTIQFDARAYQGPADKDVVEMTYKGYFKKSILNSRILLMRGTIHKSYGKFFWRGVKKVGDFKAIKRRYGS